MSLPKCITFLSPASFVFLVLFLKREIDPSECCLLQQAPRRLCPGLLWSNKDVAIAFLNFFLFFFKSDLFEQRRGSLTFKQFRCASWSRDWRQKPKFSSEMKSKLNPFSGGQFPFYYSNNPADFPFIIAV